MQTFGLGGGDLGTITTATSSPVTQIALPSRPTVADVGRIDNSGLIGALGQTHQFNPQTGEFTARTQGDEIQETRSKLQETLRALIPQRENVFEDPQIMSQQQEVQRRQQEVAGYTAQLNTIVAEQNANLLRLREVGSREGVTEAVFGGQAAQINREAAIRALPVQAQIAAAQGNLQLAQDYLTQLTSWRREAVDNEFNYRREVHNSIRGFVEGEERRL